MPPETCDFCRIVRKEAPASIIYEDDEFLAFLDFKPFAEGHTLVIPKKHFDAIYDVPDRELAGLIAVVKKAAITVKQAFSADGISIVQNNGRAADQHIFHIHFHVIPRFLGKKLLTYEDAPKVNRQELDAAAKKIRETTNSRLQQSELDTQKP